MVTDAQKRNAAKALESTEELSRYIRYSPDGNGTTMFGHVCVDGTSNAFPFAVVCGIQNDSAFIGPTGSRRLTSSIARTTR